MSGDATSESLRDAFGEVLAELGTQNTGLVVLDSGPATDTGTGRFATGFPDRFFGAEGLESTVLSIAAGLVRRDRVAVAASSVPLAPGRAYDFVRNSICRARSSVKIVATHGGLRAGGERASAPLLEDIGLMRGLPGMTVVVPADAPTTRAAIRAVVSRDGPAYVRLSGELLPRVTDGTFEIGRAAELRAGTDVCLVAVGAMVAPALSAAREFEQVGVSVRVLDLASVKPFDAPALLRAARDTGGILVLEEHSMLTGVGALVAATTSENYPVPVRRIGVPDVGGEAGGAGTPHERLGLSADRIRDEVWELLRLRGKIQ
jgi:transketolase